MGGARRMTGVAVATPTSLLPHKHFRPLLATPKAHQIYTFNVFGHTIFENDSPPMLTTNFKHSLSTKSASVSSSFFHILLVSGSMFSWNTVKLKVLLTAGNWRHGQMMLAMRTVMEAPRRFRFERVGRVGRPGNKARYVCRRNVKWAWVGRGK